MLVRDRMSTKVITAQLDLSIAEARAIMDRHRIRHLPVVSQRQLVGIVTDRDLRSAPPTTQTVADVMTPKPVVVAPSDPVDEAARVLRAHKFGALPVVQGKRLVGMLTADDVLDAFVDLSGVREPTYHLSIVCAEGVEAERHIRQIIIQEHGQLKWLHRDSRRHPTQVDLRLKARRIDDVVTQLEAAGFDVSAVVSSTHK
jgi:acetoin utilization protein AcuB